MLLHMNSGIVLLICVDIYMIQSFLYKLKTNMSFQENTLHPCFHYANSAPNGVFLIKHRTQESQNSPMATLQNVFPAVACYIRPMGASQHVFPEVVLCTGPMEACSMCSQRWAH